MIAPIAKSKAVEVLEGIIEIYAGLLTANGDEPDQFTLARMKRDANSAIGVDRVNSCMALGLIAALEWDEASVHKYFKSLIGTTTSAMVHANYGSALQFIGRQTMAAVQFCIASELEPTDLNALREAITATKYAGQFEAAQVLCAKLKLLSPADADQFWQIADVYQVLKANNISQSYIEKYNAIADAFVQEKKIRIPFWEISVDLEDQIVFSKMLINLPFEQVYELDDQLAHRLIAELPDFSSSPYWIGFDCATKKMPKHEH